MKRKFVVFNEWKWRTNIKLLLVWFKSSTVKGILIISLAFCYLLVVFDELSSFSVLLFLDLEVLFYFCGGWNESNDDAGRGTRLSANYYYKVVLV